MLTEPDYQPPTSVLGVFGFAGVTMFSCIIMGGFVMLVLLITWHLFTTVIGVTYCLIRHWVRCWHMEREIDAARRAAGILGLPEARPAPNPRVQWGGAPQPMSN
jgi:hypothetical protein